eukprot:COSAG01_NODE_17185_length_1172_cov_1.099720_1_plen_92_part_00
MASPEQEAAAGRDDLLSALRQDGKQRLRKIDADQVLPPLQIIYILRTRIRDRDSPAFLFILSSVLIEMDGQMQAERAATLNPRDQVGDSSD